MIHSHGATGHGTTSDSLAPRARAVIVVLPTRGLYVGPSLRLTPHTNVVGVYAAGLDGPFDLTVGGRLRRTRYAFIAPGTLHHLRSEGDMVFLYVDPLSQDAERLAVDRGGVPDRVVEGLRDIRLVSGDEGADVAARVESVLRPLGTGGIRASEDPAIARAVLRLESDPAAPWTVKDLARSEGLSTPRFQHRFKDAMGLPFRRYRVWLRLRMAISAFAAGASVTEAAIDTGFADGTHFATTFRRFFGLAPSELRRANARFVIVHSEEQACSEPDRVRFAMRGSGQGREALRQSSETGNLTSSISGTRSAPKR